MPYNPYRVDKRREKLRSKRQVKALLAHKKAKGICGAKTKQTGQPCKGTPSLHNGRCYMHGSKATGPKTYDGWAKAIRNLPQFRNSPERLAEALGNPPKHLLKS